MAMKELEKKLNLEILRIAADPLATKPIKKKLKTKLLEVQVPHSYRQPKLSDSGQSRELEIRLNDLNKFNDKFEDEGKTKFKVHHKEFQKYLENFEVFLHEKASIGTTGGLCKELKPPNSVVECVVLRVFRDYLLVLSFDNSEEFVVEVKCDFPGLGRSVAVGDVLRVFTPEDYQLICCYSLEVKDAKKFLNQLEHSSKFFEDFSRCCAVWNYILNLKIDEYKQRIEVCRKVLHVCEKAKLLQQQPQLSAMMRHFWDSFKGSKFLNELLPSIVREQEFKSNDHDVELVKMFIEYIIQVLPVCGVKALGILSNLKLASDDIGFMQKLMSTLALNVAGVKDDPQNNLSSMAMKELENILGSEISRVAADLIANTLIKEKLITKLLEVQVPDSYRQHCAKLSDSGQSRELGIRLDDLKEFNDKFEDEGKAKFKANDEEFKKYLENFEVFLHEKASSKLTSAGDLDKELKPQNSVVEGVVLRKFCDYLLVLSFDNSKEFVVKVKRDFPGLGRSVAVGDVLRVFTPQDYELICCYSLEVKDAKDFLNQLEHSSKFFEDFSRCHAVWNYILNLKIDDKQRIEVCRKVLHVCEKAKLLQQQPQLSAMMRHFWDSFKGSKFLNELLPSIVGEQEFKSKDHDVELVKIFVEYIIQVLPVCGVIALGILSNLKLIVSDDIGFMQKLMSTLALNVAGVKDDPQNLQWNQKPLIPTTCEISNDTCLEDLPCMKVKSKKDKDKEEDKQEEEEEEEEKDSKLEYSSEEEYLNTNFTLLRAECFHNLNDGIRQFRKDGETDSKNTTCMIYRIKLLEVKSDHSQEGLAFQLSFRPNNTNSAAEVDPDNCRWLMRGNLLCISLDDSFQCPIWATVAQAKDKKQLKEKKVYVTLCTESNRLTYAEVITKLQRLCDQGFEAYMCESSTFYVAFGPALDLLQHKRSVPFKEQLVYVNKCTKPPEYLKNIKKRPDWSVIFSKPLCNEQNTVPYSYEQLMEDFNEMKGDKVKYCPKLDDKQLEAVEKALSNELSLIQGPPGTGKSHVGETLLQFLLSMDVLKLKGCGPVLIVTYKNFALDHFLESCLSKIPDFKSKLGRVGGGGDKDNEDLEECKLYNLINWHDNQDQLDNQLEAMQPEIDSCIKDLRNSNRSSNILHVFVKEASDKHLESLLDSDDKKKRFNILMRDKDFKVKHYKELLKMLEGPLEKWLPSKEDFGNSLEMNDKHCSDTVVKFPSYKLASDKLLSADNETADCVGEVDHNEERKERDGNFDDETEDITNNQAAGPETIPVSDQDNKEHWILPEISKEKLAMFKSILNAGDIQKLNQNERIQLVYALHGQYYKSVSERFLQITDDFSKKCQMRKEFMDQHKIDVLKKRGVIGMTVSGAAIKASWLETIKPSIMIVEEAAEILEPQLAAIIPSSVQHLIMIGDHKQLRPQVSRIGSKCNLQVSMFERLITSGKMDYTQLDTQGRMSDEIANLVRVLEIYDKYKTRHKPEVIIPNPSQVVKKKCKPLTSFLPKPMFFYTHTSKEEGTRSKYNQYEAQKIVKFAEFLCSNEIKPSDITILCSYRDQVKEINNMDKDNSVNDIAVTTIDSFQGKENDIILVSLVRSTSKDKNTMIGYLKSINRICVTVSRARLGLYLFGNSTLLSKKSSKGWKKVIGYLKDEGFCGELEKSYPFKDAPVDPNGAVGTEQQDGASSKKVYNIYGDNCVVQIGDNNTCHINQGSDTTQYEHPPPQQGTTYTASSRTDQVSPEIQQIAIPCTEVESTSPERQSLEETRKSDGPEPEAQKHSFYSVSPQEEPGSPERQSSEETRKSDGPEPEAQERSFYSVSPQEEPSSPEGQSSEETRKSDGPEPEAQQHPWHTSDASDGSTTVSSETHPEQETNDVDKRRPQQETDPPVGKSTQATNPGGPEKKD